MSTGFLLKKFQSYDGRLDRLMADLKWFDGYSGQTIEELLALAGEYRIDSPLVALAESRHPMRNEESEQLL